MFNGRYVLELILLLFKDASKRIVTAEDNGGPNFREKNSSYADVHSIGDDIRAIERNAKV